MATIYNYPYYPQHRERMGFEKDADWVEFKIYIPDAIPEKHKRTQLLSQSKQQKERRPVGFVTYNRDKNE